MGFIKVIVIAFLIIYLVNKVFGLVIKYLVGNSSANNHRNASGRQSYQSSNYKRSGEINIDYVPNEKSKNDSKDFKGGEYVDYEEIKE